MNYQSEDIRTLTDEIVTWADSVFPDRKPESALLKLFEETGELVRDPSSASEYADICIMIFDLAHMYDIDLARAIRDKLEINKRRMWTRSLTGTLQHEADSFEIMFDREAIKSAYEAGTSDALEGRNYGTGLSGEWGDELKNWYDRGWHSCEGKD